MSPFNEAEIVAARLTEARAAHSRGWLLTPVTGKRPTLKAWTTAPPPSLEQVEEWARKGSLGLRTGVASGVVVIDDDTEDGSGLAGLDLPPTPTVITGSGKRHAYFKCPEGGLGNSVKKLGPGLDIRGDGGQVVFPGSIHPDTGDPYRWAPGRSPDDLPLAEIPEGLLTRLRGSETGLRRACRNVASAQKGQRNSTLNGEAFKLARSGIPRSEAEPALRQAALDAGLELGEIEKTIDSAYSAGVAGVAGVATDPEPPLDIHDLRERIAGLTIEGDPEGLDLLAALERDGIIREVARQEKSTHRGLVGELLGVLRVDPKGDDAKSVRQAVNEEFRNVREARKGAAKGDRSPEPTAIDRLLDLTADWVLFHDGTDCGFATRVVEGRVETFDLSSRQARNVMYRAYYQEHSVATTRASIDEAINNLQATARIEGEEHEVHLRFAGGAEEVWYDLADSEYRTVVVTRDGWEVSTEPAHKFVRSSNSQPQLVPEPGGSLDELWDHLHVTSEDVRKLILAWLIGCYFCDAPRWGAIITGPQGSAKTTATKMLRSLVDPARAPTSRSPRDEKDLAVKCLGNGILALDNLSRLRSDMADLLCSVLTGEGYEARALFTDRDSVIFTYRRPLILNGISGISNRPDLLDRCLAIQLEPFKEGERRQERDLCADFERARPRLLGAILDAVAGVIRALPEVAPPDGIRMADAAMIGVALEKGLAWDPGSFVKAVNRNSEIQNAEILGESALTAPIRRLLAAENFEGTAEVLLERLGAIAGPEACRRKAWPKTPSSLSGAIDRLAPALTSIGIKVDRSYRHGGVKVIGLRGNTREATPGSSASPPTPPTPEGADPAIPAAGDAGDAGVALYPRGRNAASPRKRGVV